MKSVFQTVVALATAVVAMGLEMWFLHCVVELWSVRSRLAAEELRAVGKRRELTAQHERSRGPTTLQVGRALCQTRWLTLGGPYICSSARPRVSLTSSHTNARESTAASA